MIKIVANNYVKPEAKEEFLTIVEELIEKSQKEEGCISYVLFEDISNANHLTFIEEWKDEVAIKIHNDSEHFQALVPKLGALCEKPGEVNLYKQSRG